MSFNDNSILYVPHYIQLERRGLYLLIDPEAPNWIATDGRGARILHKLRAGRTFKELVNEYAADYGMEATRAWLHVDCFLKDARRYRFADSKPLFNFTYTGRRDYLSLDALQELWIHTNNSCNLTCAHCLVNSSPQGDVGLPGEKLRKIIDQAHELGVNRFYFTGGEPMVRSDFFELAEYITERRGKELIVLTNGTLLRGERLEGLRRPSPKRLKLQISLDGSSPQVNDPIRGEGSFERIVEGIRNVVSLGFAPTVTTAVCTRNVNDLEATAELLARLGVRNYHLLWLHRRGRALRGDGFFPYPEELIATVRRLKRRADELGITVDNFEALKARLDSRCGTKFDLGSAGIESLCVYPDGWVYPSAALAGCPELRCGNVMEQPLEVIWQNSQVCQELRNATVQRKALCQDCHLRFLCGGGDIEHSYLYSQQISRSGRGFLGPDPYCGLHRAMIEEVLFGLAEEGRRAFNRKSGFDAPVVYRAMGERAAHCAEDSPVQTVHSTCVLSFHADKRRAVEEFYAQAAEEPKENLCCVTGYSAEDTSHIPQEVLDRAYGCGSPVGLAEVREGEVVLDLGSGAGIDCFIAARKTGPSGMVIGLDMTDGMLKIATENKVPVAENLGYDAVRFLKGFMEAIPLRDKSVDLITSNCVINLSPDKKRVFREMWRVLKDHGRILVSDIVSQGEVSPHIRANERLWGECIGGALTEEDFLSFLEQAGFYGLQTLKKSFYKEVDGHRFYSITVRAYKFEKREGCAFIGQRAVYHGPFKAVMDEEGHLFPRHEAVEVCTDTATKLCSPPYRGLFTVTDPIQGGSEDYSYCGDECCSVEG